MSRADIFPSRGLPLARRIRHSEFKIQNSKFKTARSLFPREHHQEMAVLRTRPQRGGAGSGALVARAPFQRVALERKYARIRPALILPGGAGRIDVFAADAVRAVAHRLSLSAGRADLFVGDREHDIHAA